MTSMELKVLEIVWEQGGSTAVDVVARKLGMSNEYARMACLSLGRAEYIDTNGRRCMLTGKGKLEIAKKKVNASKQAGIEVAVQEPEPPQKTGMIIGY